MSRLAYVRGRKKRKVSGAGFYIKSRITYLNARVSLVVPASVDLHNGECRGGRVRAEAVHERRQICVVCKLVEVARDPELVGRRRSGNVRRGVVQSAQARRRDRRRAAGWHSRSRAGLEIR